MQVREHLNYLNHRKAASSKQAYYRIVISYQLKTVEISYMHTSNYFC